MPVVAPLSFNPAFRSGGFRPFNAFEGTLVGGGTAGGLLTMLLQSVASGYMHEQGMLGFGFTQQNLHQRMMAMRSHQQHMEMVQMLAERDRETFFQTFRGVAQLAGTPWGMEQQQAADSLAGSAVSFAPMMTMLAPDFFDEMAGRRGSAAVMGSRMFSGGRFRIDPITGQYGMSVSSVRTMADTVFTELLTGSASRRTGLSAGQLGESFQELQRLGVVAGGRVNPDDLSPQLIADAAARNGITLGPDGDTSKLSSRDLQTLLSDRQVSAAVRQFDAQRVTRTLEQYQGVVQSLREVFGADGQGDAPLPKLLEALQQLSGGGLQQVDAAKLEQMVRTTHNLANMSGVNLSGALMLNQFSTAMAQQMGLSTLVAPELTQHMLAFGSAIQGQGVLGHQAFGLSDLDQQRLQAGQLAASAGRSPLANRIAAALRLQEAVGPDAFAKGSQAEQFLSAVRSGYLPQVMNEEEFTQMLVNDSGGRFTSAMLRDLYQQTDANAEMGARFGLATVVRRGMRGEVLDYLQRNLDFTAGQQLEGALGAGRGGALGVELSAAFVSSLSGMNAATRTDRTRRNQRLSAAMRQRIRDLAAGGNAEAQQLLQQHANDPEYWLGLSEALYGQAESASRDPMNPFGARSLQDTLLQFDPDVMNQAERSQAQAEAQSAFQRALAPLGGDNMLRAAVQAVIDADDTTTLSEVFTQAMGGIRIDDAQTELTAELQSLRAANADLETARQAVIDAADPLSRAAARASLDAKVQGMEDVTRRLGDFLERNGYYLGATVNRRQVAQLGDAHRFSSALIAGFRHGQLSAADLTFLGDATNQRLARLATSLGMDAGQVAIMSQADIDAAVAAGTLSPADARFLRQTGGQLRDRLNRALTRERSGSEDLVAQALTDPQLLQRLGQGGVSTIRDVQQYTKTLDELAAKYAGGDMAALLRGDLTGDVTPDEQARIMAMADQARYEREAAVRRFRRMIGTSQRGYEHLADYDTLSDVAKSLSSKDLPIAVRSVQDLLTLGDDDLATLQAEMSADQWEAVQRSRSEQSKLKDAIADLRRDALKSPEEIIREGFSNLGIDSDDAIKEALGGDAAYQDVLDEVGKTGETSMRRRAGFLAMTRDIARQRELEGKQRLTAEEQAELESLTRLTAGYDAQLRQLGTDEGFDLGSDTFLQAYLGIASKAESPESSQEINVRITGGSITLNDDGTADLELNGAGTRGGI